MSPPKASNDDAIYHFAGKATPTSQSTAMHLDIKMQYFNSHFLSHFHYSFGHCCGNQLPFGKHYPKTFLLLGI